MTYNRPSEGCWSLIGDVPAATAILDQSLHCTMPRSSRSPAAATGSKGKPTKLQAEPASATGTVDAPCGGRDRGVS